MGRSAELLAVGLRCSLAAKARTPLITLLELFVPSLFALLLCVGYWEQQDTIDSAKQFHGDGLVNQATAFYLRQLFCTNSTNSTEKPEILLLFPPCPDPSNITGDRYGCLSAPFEDICYLDSREILGLGKLITDHNLWVEPIHPIDFDARALVSTFFSDQLESSFNKFGMYVSSDSLNGIAHSGMLALIGTDEQTKDFRAYCMNKTMFCYRLLLNKTFRTSEDLSDFVEESKGGIWAGLDLSRFDDEAATLAIRLNYTATPWTFQTVIEGSMGSKHTLLYPLSGFTILQTMAVEFFLARRAGFPPDPPKPPMAFFTDFPTARHTHNYFLDNNAQFFPLIMMFGFLYFLSRLVSAIVEEKETRVKTALIAMGMPRAVLHAMHFITAAITITISTAFLSYVCSQTFLHNVRFTFLWFINASFGLTIIGLGFILSAFFSKARISALVSPLVMFLTAVPYYAIPAGVSNTQLALACLLPCTAYGQAIMLLASYADLGFGVGWTEMFVDDFSFGACIGLMLLTVVLYMLIGSYLDLIIPSEYGAARHPLFFLGYSRRTKHVDLEDSLPHPSRVEKDSATGPVIAGIYGAHKIYEDGRVHAMKGVTVECHEGQIHVLLGHNGAGKSSSIHLLTGFLTPDQGVVQGAQNVGFCPQSNILWKRLTVREHLIFYRALKGAEWDECEELVDRLHLRHQLSLRTEKLSGGQKRKLSVALAIMGNVDFIALDEPTAGMDVEGRQMMWDMLRDTKRHTSLLICTHFMGEADALADRITLLSFGAVFASGSPLFLKSLLGTGYKLQLVHAENDISHKLECFVKQHGLPVSNSVGGVTTHKIDLNVTMEHLCSVLEEIESNAAEYGIRTLSLSHTTMEDVFVRLATVGLPGCTAAPPLSGITDDSPGRASADPDPAVIQIDSEKMPLLGAKVPLPLLDGANEEVPEAIPVSPLRQIQLALYKRICCAKRDRRFWLYQILLPVLFLALALAIFLIRPPSQPALPMDNSMYKNKKSEVLFADNSFLPLANQLPESYRTTPRSAQTMPSYPTTPVSEALLSEYFLHRGSDRWIAFASGAKNDSKNVVILHNASAIHALPQGLAALHSAYLSSITPPSSKAARSFKVYNHPLPMGSSENQFFDSIKLVISGIFVLIPFTFIPAQYASNIVREREVKAAHLQWLSGMGILTYWIGSVIMDFASYLLTVVLALLVFLLFGRSEFVGDLDTAAATISLLVLYGFSTIPMSYVASFAFRSHTTAQTTVLLGNFFTGFMLVLIAQILLNDPNTAPTTMKMMKYYRVIPSYSLGEGLIQLSQRDVSRLLLGYKPGPFERIFQYKTYSYPLFGGVGTQIFYMGCVGPVLWVLVFILHFGRWLLQFFRTKVTDADRAFAATGSPSVQRERREVEVGNGRAGDALTLQGVWKIFTGTKRVAAVRHLSLGVRPGEIFAFLGCNGAGKTTTMGMLTQETFSDSGRIVAGGRDAAKHPNAIRRYLSYCPQFDALLDEMSVEEHLRFYGSLGGVPPGAPLNAMMERLIDAFDLQKYRGFAARSLSGGNRRKLSTAIALCGYPKLILLDEPTSGMDPVARRGMWGVISRLKHSTSVILTTHHLEEVEAVADRVGIIAKGEMKELGTLLELKQAYGKGYEATLQCASGRKAAVLEALAAAFPDAEAITGASLTVSVTFGQSARVTAAIRFLLEQQNKKEIEQFGITQCTMESVFMRIANYPMDEYEADAPTDP